MPNDSTTPRTVGDIIADLRHLHDYLAAVYSDRLTDGAIGLLDEAADLLEQMVPSSALLPDQVPS